MRVKGPGERWRLCGSRTGLSDAGGCLGTAQVLVKGEACRQHSRVGVRQAAEGQLSSWHLIVGKGGQGGQDVERQSQSCSFLQAGKDQWDGTHSCKDHTK